jgi:hypothetical protein
MSSLDELHPLCCRLAGTAERTHFKHKPLDLSAPSIRLLQVSSQLSKDGAVQCRIAHFGTSRSESGKRLDEAFDMCTPVPSYTCLSYTWGEPNPLYLVEVDGSPFHVRQGLWEFLCTVRTSRSLRRRNFWIDAMCIDQENKAERNHQVQQMGRIYSKADMVLCWLGCDEEIESVVKDIRTRPAYIDAMSRSWKASNTLPRVAQVHLPIEPGVSAETLVRFCCSEYWSRAWITQEIALAQSAAIVARSEAVDLNLVLETVTSTNSPFHYIANYIGGRMEETSQTWKSDLLSLLYHFRRTRCDIPRDRIYSLLALCSQGNRIQVNYEVSDEEVMRHILDVYSDSLCLCSAAIIADVLWRTLWPRGRVRIQPVEEATPYIEFPVKTSDLDKHHRCHDFCETTFPEVWRRKRGVIVCMRRTCPDIPVHLLVSECHYGKVLRCINGQSCSQNHVDCRLYDTFGVELENFRESGDATLRMSFSALLGIVMNSISSHDDTRRCGNLHGNTKYKKGRPRLCHTVRH